MKRLTKSQYEVIASRFKQQVNLRCKSYSSNELIVDENYTTREIYWALFAAASFMADDFAKADSEFNKAKFMAECELSYIPKA